MCECTCSSIKGDVVFHVGQSAFVVDAYRGCRDCANLIGIDIRAFDSNGVHDYLDGNWGRKIEPNEYGGPKGAIPISYELFSVEDLINSAGKLMGDDCDIDGLSAHDWFEEYGLKLIQSAMQMCDKRRRDREERP